MMIRETQSQAQHAEFHLAREREFEKQQQRLYEEFKILDVNQDGCITLDEVLYFLQSKVRFFVIKFEYCRCLNKNWTHESCKNFSKKWTKTRVAESL